MTSPEQIRNASAEEEVIAEISGEALKLIKKVIAILKQTRSYVESRIMAEGLPFAVATQLDQKGLKLLIEIVPRPEFFELAEKEKQKQKRTREKIREIGPEPESGSTSHE